MASSGWISFISVVARFMYRVAAFGYLATEACAALTSAEGGAWVKPPRGRKRTIPPRSIKLRIQNFVITPPLSKMKLVDRKSQRWLFEALGLVWRVSLAAPGLLLNRLEFLADRVFALGEFLFLIRQSLQLLIGVVELGLSFSLAAHDLSQQGRILGLGAGLIRLRLLTGRFGLLELLLRGGVVRLYLLNLGFYALKFLDVY